jgi:hypothetical protein
MISVGYIPLPLPLPLGGELSFRHYLEYVLLKLPIVKDNI